MQQDPDGGSSGPEAHEQGEQTGASANAASQTETPTRYASDELVVDLPPSPEEGALPESGDLEIISSEDATALGQPSMIESGPAPNTLFDDAGAEVTLPEALSMEAAHPVDDEQTPTDLRQAGDLPGMPEQSSVAPAGAAPLTWSQLATTDWTVTAPLHTVVRPGAAQWAGARPSYKPHLVTRRFTARWVVVTVVVWCLLALGSFGAVQAYHQYMQVRAEAADGILHLHNVETLLATESKRPGIPDAVTLQRAKSDLTAAEQDFARLRSDLGTGIFAVAAHAPGVSGTAASAAKLAAAASEACLAGLDVVDGLTPLVPVLKGGFVASAAAGPSVVSGSPPPPTLTEAMLSQLTTHYEDAIRHLDAAVADARGADLSALPAQLVKPQQVAELRGALARWPSIQAQLAEIDAWLKVAPALLGVTAPERFLVELMDRSELRATGGFIGNYGVMTVQNGKVQPFTLSDIYLLDYPYVIQHHWPGAPAAYPWWPYPGFALRDSNVSANFPTTAQAGIKLLAAEGGPDVQGVIAFTAPAIARVIAVVGPVAVPEYHETVTATNLESLIHHYQETSAYTAGNDLPPSDRVSSTRKRFTALLGRAFIGKLHGLPADQLVAIGRAVLTSLHTKDIQAYLTSPAAEALLARHGLDGVIAHGPGDGLTIVDANVGSNKANLFTTAAYTDAVTLDTQGTATHHLTITYTFSSAIARSMDYLLYGRYFYLTYLRIYAPTSAHLASFDGFNAGSLEINASDEPGRQMWGGYVYIQDGVPHSLHFVWSERNAVTRDASGHWRYTLDVQHQAGSNQQLNLTVTAPGAKAPILSYKGTLTEDHISAVTY